MKIDSTKIRILIADKEMKLSDIATMCGIYRQNLSTILSRGTCALKTAGKLAKALDIPVSEIIKEE